MADVRDIQGTTAGFSSGAQGLLASSVGDLDAAVEKTPEELEEEVRCSHAHLKKAPTI